VVQLPPLLLGDVAAAAAIGRSPSWIRATRAADAKAKAEGRPMIGPPWVRIGRAIFYKPAALERWIAENGEECGVVELTPAQRAAREAHAQRRASSSEVAE